MPFKMKRAVRASRKLCGYLQIYTNERHPPLHHLTLIEIFQISVCQMSVDKRFNFYMSMRPTSLSPDRGFCETVCYRKINNKFLNDKGMC